MRGSGHFSFTKRLSELGVWETYGDCETRGHPVQVVRMATHLEHFRYDRGHGPLNAKHFRQLLQVFGRSFADREDGVIEP